ncbi:thiamine diphosphokinase [Lapidilactobacillus gannanensis]|uniref:Thiamine diphosphokinase n=1 Tax=Lapidilactobacillus gannanensis TaxID=2486002 RepID=A0ABW4BSI5_9LACO|nr:thiamine diphosphokinase [Lapidilactobacillus gannanensis]
MNRINVMLGGPQNLVPAAVYQARRSETWIGVDHGIVALLQQRITPAIGLGDFDSLSVFERRLVDRQVHDLRYAQAQKDFTDSQWAVQTACTDLKADQVALFAGTGGRLDHELVNLFMMTMPAYRQWLDRVRLIDQKNEVRFFSAGAYQLPYQTDYRYLSFVSLTPVTGLTLRQVKYPLTNYQADYPTSWSSNEFLPEKPAWFTFETGIVAVILSRD